MTAKKRHITLKTLIWRAVSRPQMRQYDIAQKRPVHAQKRPVTARRRPLLHKRDLLLHKRDLLLHKRDLLLHKRDLLLHKRDLLLHKRDLSLHKRDLLLHKCDLLLHKRDLFHSGHLFEALFRGCRCDNKVSRKSETCLRTKETYYCRKDTFHHQKSLVRRALFRSYRCDSTAKYTRWQLQHKR